MLKFPQFSEIKINIPPLDVQRETGEILSGADLEVGQLQDLRSQLRMQKRGLMQKLLSGDWPVPASIDRLLPGGQGVDAAVGAEVQRAEATG
jgi:type I restriction enzyme S subunit